MNCCQCNGMCNHVGMHSYCARHGGTTLTYHSGTIGTTGAIGWTPLPHPPLSEDDVERIAVAVVEILEDRKSLKKSARHPKRALRNSVPLDEVLP